MGILHRHDYLLSALPGLEPIGSTPPMSKSDFLSRVIESSGPIKTVEVLLLNDDLTQYEAILSEEIEFDQADLVLLSTNSTDNIPVLPDYLMLAEHSHENENKRILTDQLWSRFFRYAAAVARRKNSKFLKEWVGFEVGLRNAIVTARANILEIDPVGYYVSPELSDKNTDYNTILSSWSSAANPLAALEVLDKAKWERLEAHGRWYSCSASEIEVYAAKLVLLHHWRRILSEKQQSKVGVA